MIESTTSHLGLSFLCRAISTDDPNKQERNTIYVLTEVFFLSLCLSDILVLHQILCQNFNIEFFRDVQGKMSTLVEGVH